MQNAAEFKGQQLLHRSDRSPSDGDGLHGRERADVTTSPITRCQFYRIKAHHKKHTSFITRCDSIVYKITEPMNERRESRHCAHMASVTEPDPIA